MSAFSTLLSIFTEPTKAMADVKQRSMIWLPLLLLVLAPLLLQILYFQSVDFSWLQDQLLSRNPNMPADAREQARQFMSPGMMMGMSVAGILIVVPVVLLVVSVYYLLAAKVIGSDIGFGKWFAFTLWTSIPTLLAVPAGLVRILASNNAQILPEAINPLSLNELLLHLPAASPWASLASAVDVTRLWSILVAVIGYKLWTQRSTITSSIVVLLPTVVVFGIMALFAILRSAA